MSSRCVPVPADLLQRLANWTAHVAGCTDSPLANDDLSAVEALLRSVPAEDDPRWER